MKIPSIKGTALQSVHEDVHRLIEAGRLSREALELRLEPEDLLILDAKVAPATWYPIASYARLVEMLVHEEAEGRAREYLMARGARTAERLSAAGIYQQLHASTEQMGPAVGRIVITLASVIYNFTKWHFESRGPDHEFTLFVTEAAEFPEVSRFTTQGFIEFVSNRTSGMPTRVESERPSPDCIIYDARRHP